MCYTTQGETNINGAGCVGEPNFGTISCQSAINSTTMHPDGGGPIVVHCSAGMMWYQEIVWRDTAEIQKTYSRTAFNSQLIFA